MLLLEKMYQEKHFMNNRSVEAYRKKQAGSCLFLLTYLSKMSNSPEKRLLSGCLSLCHRQQYEDLTGEAIPKYQDFDAPSFSFYFDMMLSKILQRDEEISVVALLVVMYERGRLRYEELVEKDGASLWADLKRDAANNRNLCLRYLEVYCKIYDVKKWTKMVVQIEADLMKEIDRRNKEKTV